MEGQRKHQPAAWVKYSGNPVLGGRLGVCFDVCVLLEDGEYRMYFSWRDKGSIALARSRDGYSFDEPEVVLSPRPTAAGYEDDVNRPVVLRRGGRYYMWYTGQYKPGQADGTSHIFCAVSDDGVHFERAAETPVLSPEAEWEKSAVMSPHVLFDEASQLYKMWYSAGEQYEPNAIGYAVSDDGLQWQKQPENPVFTAGEAGAWDSYKVAGCQVIRTGDIYTMLYIGYPNDHDAKIGMAYSRDGVTGWERAGEGPIITPDAGAWDSEACYKPYAVFDGRKWRLYYNGRTGGVEQIGLAERTGADL